MDKLSYLKACFQALSPMEKKSWHVNVFAIPLPHEVTDFSSYDHLDLVNLPSGLVVVINTAEGKMTEQITDYKKNQPLFTMEDMIMVDSEWVSTIKTPTEKRLGGLIINRVVLIPIVKNKLLGDVSL